MNPRISAGLPSAIKFGQNTSSGKSNPLWKTLLVSTLLLPGCAGLGEQPLLSDTFHTETLRLVSGDLCSGVFGDCYEISGNITQFTADEKEVLMKAFSVTVAPGANIQTDIEVGGNITISENSTVQGVKARNAIVKSFAQVQGGIEVRGEVCVHNDATTQDIKARYVWRID